MNKLKEVFFINENLRDSFFELKSGKFEDKQLYEFIDRAIDDLKISPNCGIKILRNCGQKSISRNMQLQTYGNIICQMHGG